MEWPAPPSGVVGSPANQEEEGMDISVLGVDLGKNVCSVVGLDASGGVVRRLAERQARSAPLVASFEGWIRAERAKLSRHYGVTKALDYMLTRWPAFTRFLEDGRICLTNNAAERALRGLALGRKSWLFAGSARGAERAAVMYTLIQTAKLNDVDPQAWLADVLSRLAETPQSRLSELLPLKWRTAPWRAPPERGPPRRRTLSAAHRQVERPAIDSLSSTHAGCPR